MKSSGSSTAPFTKSPIPQAFSRSRQIALHIGEVCAEIAQDFVHGMVNLIVENFTSSMSFSFQRTISFRCFASITRQTSSPNTAARSCFTAEAGELSQKAKQLPDRPRTGFRSMGTGRTANDCHVCLLPSRSRQLREVVFPFLFFRIITPIPKGSPQ